MKVLTSKKAIIGLLSLGSIVLAGTIKDINSRTVKKVETYEDLAPVERNLASDEEAQRIAQAYVPMNEFNIKRVNTNWEVIRIIGSDEVVAFDKNQNPEDAKKSIRVKMELIGTSMVRIDNDNDQVYRISMLTEFGTIALFKKMGNGFEIIEAKVIASAKKEELAVSEDVELVLERALNQSKSPKILTGSDASGSMTLSKKSIEGLTVELRNANGEVQHVEIATADLMDGGSFKADIEGEEVSGVVFNNGKDGYRLSFVTGPLAGAMLNFVTQEQMNKIEEEQANNNDNYFEAEEEKAAEVAQAEVLEERKEVAGNTENYEPVRVLSAEEIKETAETSGFAF